MDNYLKDLSVQFSRLSTQEERLDLLENALREHSPTAEEIRLPLTLGDAQNHSRKKENTRDENIVKEIYALGTRYGLQSLMVDRVANKMLDGILPDEEKWSSPILKLPCANVNPSLHKKCYETGIHACSGCRLVSYCSNVCCFPATRLAYILNSS
jgi:hypothetical protein